MNDNIIYTFKVRAVRNIKTASTKQGFYMKFRKALLFVIVLLAGALFAAGIAAFSSEVYAGTGSGRRVSLGIELPDIPIRTKTPSPVPGEDPTPSPSPTPSPDKTDAPSPAPSPTPTAAPTDDVHTNAPTGVPATVTSNTSNTGHPEETPAETVTVTDQPVSTEVNTPDATVTLPLDVFETVAPSPDETAAPATVTAGATATAEAAVTAGVTASAAGSATDSVPATGGTNVTPGVQGEKDNSPGGIPAWVVVCSVIGAVCIIAIFVLLFIRRSKKKK